MPKRFIAYVPAVAAGLCTVMAFSTNWALAAGKCVGQPNHQSAQDGHWHYRVDRVSHRKCWYLVELRTRMPQAEAPEARPAPDATSQPMLSSFFSLLLADLKGARTAGAQQDAANGDARPVQTDGLKNGEVSRLKRARIARHPDSNTAPAPTLNRPSPTVPHVERMAQPLPLDTAERDALFQEFLRWNAQQTP
jgi:hypothetical protein